MTLTGEWPGAPKVAGTCHGGARACLRGEVSVQEDAGIHSQCDGYLTLTACESGGLGEVFVGEGGLVQIYCCVLH